MHLLEEDLRSYLRPYSPAGDSEGKVCSYKILWKAHLCLMASDQFPELQEVAIALGFSVCVPTGYLVKVTAQSPRPHQEAAQEPLPWLDTEAPLLGSSSYLALSPAPVTWSRPLEEDICR